MHSLDNFLLIFVNINLGKSSSRWKLTHTIWLDEMRKMMHSEVVGLNKAGILTERQQGKIFGQISWMINHTAEAISANKNKRRRRQDLGFERVANAQKYRESSTLHEISAWTFISNTYFGTSAGINIKTILKLLRDYGEGSTFC